MSSLPKFVVFKSTSNNKYLRYKIDTTLTCSFVKFDGDNVMDPFAQFEVLEANIGGGFVHLKCRYTNLYLVRGSRSHHWISASAYEPQEDQTSWTCTLFKPTVVEDFGNTKTIRLLHVQLASYVRLAHSVSPDYRLCLLADSRTPDCKQSFDLLTAIDWESLLRLPKRVAFKGDNGKYLGAKSIHGRPSLQFSYDDAQDLRVAHEIIPFCDGTISIKSEYYRSFWRVLTEDIQNFIVVDEDLSNRDTGTFRVFPIDVNIFVLVCMNPSSYVKRLTNNERGWKDAIAAAEDHINKYARLEVVALDIGQEPTDLPTDA